MSQELRPGSRIDLHVHTATFSLDSGLSPEFAVARARSQGLSALCFTEHNAAWPEADLRALSERLEFPLFSGMEVSTDVGHVLVFGLDHYRPEMALVKQLRRFVRADGGAMALAHPNRSPAYSGSWADAPALFDAIEAVNGDESLASHRLGQGLADGLGIPAIGGSDAHTAAAIGRAFTSFSVNIANERQLIQALLAGEVSAILNSFPPPTTH